MILAEVTGNIVCEQLTDWLQSPTLLSVMEVDASGKRIGAPFVALDLVGARHGEVVLISQGSSVRQTEETKDRPVDAVIAGIVDLIDRGGQYSYRKDGRAN